MLQRVGRPDLMESRPVPVINWEELCTQHKVGRTQSWKACCRELADQTLWKADLFQSSIGRSFARSTRWAAPRAGRHAAESWQTRPYGKPTCSSHQLGGALHAAQGGPHPELEGMLQRVGRPDLMESRPVPVINW